jgi:hypothetical protein
LTLTSTTAAYDALTIARENDEMLVTITVVALENGAAAAALTVNATQRAIRECYPMEGRRYHHFPTL